MTTKTTVEISQKAIEDGLRELGLGEGDLVFFHSNLRALGAARDLVKLPNAGADLVVDAFLSVVGPTGTVAAPALTATYAEGQGPSGEVFDPRSTPSRVGSITNIFLQRPDNIRSHHPTHSVSAIGRLAAEYTAGHELVPMFDWDSPYGRTVRWDGYICYFGTTSTTNTHIHAVEQWMGLPYLEQQEALVRGLNGQVLKVKVLGSPPGPRNFYKQDSEIHRILKAANIWKTTTIGRAEVTLMKARDCFDVAFRAIIEKPDVLMSLDDDPWTAKYRRKTIDHVRSRWGGPADA